MTTANIYSNANNISDLKYKDGALHFTLSDSGRIDKGTIQLNVAGENVTIDLENVEYDDDGRPKIDKLIYEENLDEYLKVNESFINKLNKIDKNSKKLKNDLAAKNLATNNHDFIINEGLVAYNNHVNNTNRVGGKRRIRNTKRGGRKNRRKSKRRHTR